MKLHVSNNVTTKTLHDAAKVARVTLEFTSHGSRSADHAFNVTLRGESRRRPNFGTSKTADRFAGPYSDYAATWDQWGVFFAEIFKADPYAHCTSYADVADFNEKTNDRFVDGWPEDTHGDHTFRWAGVPRQQTCTKCTATMTWGV